MDAKNILPGMVALIVFVVAIILVQGARAKASLRRTYPPIGRMVDIGGHRLHMSSQGKGSPTVVVEAGQGDFGLSWAVIQPEVAKFTRIVTYDRAGLGWSDPSPKPRTVEAAVEELRSLLTNADIPGPYVLVGASWGGLVVRLFAHRYPEDVVGMVLVDSSHEEQFSPEPIQKVMRQMSRMMPLMYGAFAALVGSGIAALKPTLLPDSLGLDKLPPETAATYRGLIASHAKHAMAAAAEIRDLTTSQDQMRAARITSLGDIPLVVLRHGRAQPMMASPEVSKLLEETSVRLQEELAALSSRGKLVVAEESGHVIQVDQPDLVISAIREIVAAARG